MIRVRDFRYTDYKIIQKLIPEFERRRLNYDIRYINIEKMLKCLMFFNNDNFAMLSGIDDVSDFIPNTYRILTKAITTKYRPKCWGKYFEEKLFDHHNNPLDLFQKSLSHFQNKKNAFHILSDQIKMRFDKDCLHKNENLETFLFLKSKKGRKKSI